MIVFRYLLRPLGLEIEYVNMKGKSDHIYLTFNQPSERQKLYHKIIVARQAQPQSQPQTTLNNVSFSHNFCPVLDSIEKKLISSSQ